MHPQSQTQSVARSAPYYIKYIYIIKSINIKQLDFFQKFKLEKGVIKNKNGRLKQCDGSSETMRWFD